MSRLKGFLAERQVKQYLCKQGLTWLESNYACRMGEIDLIMRDGACLVFVEVRARRSNAFGGAAASITTSKRRKLVRTASHFLLTHAALRDCATRFDVVCLDGAPPTITWLKHAFDVDAIG